MAPMSACFSAMLLLSAISIASGANIVAEQSMPPMMRRDAPNGDAPSGAVLGPAGELISVNGKVDKEATYEDSALDVKLGPPQGCDDVFPYGSELSQGLAGDCPSGSAPIEDDGKCGEAAEAMNRTAPRNFIIRPGDTWEYVRPGGCFKEPCTEDSSGECYYYNERDTVSSQTISGGQPICIRKKYKNGTATVGVADVTCDDNYEEIMTEAACRTAGICQGYCEGAQFREGEVEPARKLLYPYGCFIEHQWGCVFFNAHGTAAPTAIQGTPICKSKILPPNGAIAAI